MPSARWLNQIRPDAFLPAFLWHFLIEFPSPLPPRPGRVARLIAAATVVVGIAGIGINLWIAFQPLADPVDWRRLMATGVERGSEYWLAVFLPSVAAFFAMLARMSTSAGRDRMQLRIFLGGLVACMLPLAGAVLLEELWPPFKSIEHQPAVEPWVSVALFGALAVVPFVTAYSVLFDRVVETRVVVRAALQYLLARYTIIAATAVPFVAFGLYLVEHRAESLVVLVGGARPILMIVGVAIGFLMLGWRKRSLDALDRRFFREQYDTPLLFSRVMSDDVIARSPAEIAEHLTLEVERAFYARADLFVVDETTDALRDPRGRHLALPLKSTLVTLAVADSEPMELTMGAGSPLDRLPEAEKNWIASEGYRLVTVVKGRTGQLTGLLALGGKRSGLPFSVSDRRSLRALSVPLGLALENDRLRHTPDPPEQLAALECRTCSRLHPADADQCTCGGALWPSNAPYLLRGVFRFEWRLGTGGMGIVYSATDLDLGRRVAIKTLPRLTPDHAARLRREAQTMASLIHANLAVIYGIETWKGIPFLVEEYLGGGTLADRLRGGRMSVDAALSLGMALAGVLGHLHEAGIVHCDIKPSNIGFTESGVVKLLDFGIAYLLRGTGAAVASTASTVNAELSPAALMVTERGLMGTPLYMSPEATYLKRPAPSFDLWALSVVIYEAITGQRPFQGKDTNEVFERVRAGIFPELKAIREDCPESVALFFHKALAVDAAHRPSDSRRCSLPFPPCAPLPRDLRMRR